MSKLFKEFLKSEDGAAVVDMTMLMAALVGLCLSVMTVINTGMGDLTGDLETIILAQDTTANW